MKHIEASQLGEYISLVISTVILLFVGGYLIWNIIDASTPYVIVKAEAAQEEAVPMGGRYIMPVEIENKSDKTLELLRLIVRVPENAGLVNEQEIEVDYLSRHSSQTLYVYLNAPLTKDQIQLQPVYYKIK